MPAGELHLLSLPVRVDQRAEEARPAARQQQTFRLRHLQQEIYNQTSSDETQEEARLRCVQRRREQRGGQPASLQDWSLLPDKASLPGAESARARAGPGPPGGQEGEPDGHHQQAQRRPGRKSGQEIYFRPTVWKSIHCSNLRTFVITEVRTLADSILEPTAQTKQHNNIFILFYHHPPHTLHPDLNERQQMQVKSMNVLFG